LSRRFPGHESGAEIVGLDGSAAGLELCRSLRYLSGSNPCGVCASVARVKMNEATPIAFAKPMAFTGLNSLTDDVEQPQ